MLTPEVPGLVAVSARDGSRMYAAPVDESAAEELWAVAAHAAPDGWRPVLSSLDPQRVADAPPLLTESPRDIVARAVWPARLVEDGAWAMSFDDWWTGGDDETPLPAELAKHLTGPVRQSWRVTLNLGMRWLYLVRAPAYETPALWGLPGKPERSLADHVAVLRSWYDRFGAELLYLSGESLVLAVRHPPTDPVEIAAVALEQYAYCPDLDQILGNVEDVACVQVPTARWTFWWD